jgi:hypothetical protein
VLNLASNNLGNLVLPQGWSRDWKADYSAKEYTHTDGSKQDQHPGKPEGIIALANAIPDMRALTSLDVSKNNLGLLATEDGWTSQDGDNCAPWVHPDGRKQDEKPEGLKPFGVIAIANAIPDMRALSTFTFSGDYNSSKPVTMETTITEADFSRKGLGVSGGMLVAAFLPKCQ